MDLHDNQLESLPDSLSELTRLTRLNLGHNRLTTLPRAIYSLNELQVLQINNNQIESIDEQICEINMLNNLNLAHNKIKVNNLKLNITFSLMRLLRAFLALWDF